MDGVVADFNAFIGSVLGRTVKWTDRSITPEEWEVVAAIDNVYFQLPLLKDATTLVGYCSQFKDEYRVEFLTALPSKKLMPEVAGDKQKWVDKYFPGYKVNFGPYSTDKWKWCKPGDILIDDRSSNIIDWYEKGKGIGIYYKENITHTLSIIDKVIGKTEPMRFLDETIN
jgi:hypothetical protein